MKTVNKTKLLSVLSFLSAVLLAVLVPGGPIETRTFDTYPEEIILSFNIFLTTLTFISFINTYFLAISKKWSIYVAILCGLSYLFVYLADLFEIFPISEIAMPSMLMLIEILGSIVALLMVMIGVFSLKNKENQKIGDVANYYDAAMHLQVIKKVELTIYISLIVLSGIAIVIFATHSALGQ